MIGLDYLFLLLTVIAMYRRYRDRYRDRYHYRYCHVHYRYHYHSPFCRFH